MIQKRLSAYLRLMRMNNPIGSLLLLWPTLWALWIASEGQPTPGIMFIFVLGVLLMRSAGCVINDYADRHIDPHVHRTGHRPLVTGDVSPQEALRLFALLCLIAFGLVLLLNWQTVLLSFVAVLLAAVYPFMKRYTHLPQIVLGLAFSWGIPMAFASETGTVPLLAWLLLLANLLWTVAYDTLYAMVDREDDLQIGVKSTAILFGQADRFIIAMLQTVFLLLLWLIGQILQFNWLYQLALLVTLSLFVWQHWLIRNRERDGCFSAFLNNNWAGAAIFAGIALHYLMV